MVEAQPEGETKKCPTCERQIELAKFRMHDIGCARMNYKCRECGEVVPKADKEEHEAEAHAKVACKYCSFSEMKSKFGSHEERCELRPKVCEYCDKEFAFEKFHDHHEMCGSRTEKCPVCNRFICLRDKQMHLQTDQCAVYQAENARNDEIEKMKAMDELRKFQEKEEKERQKANEKKALEEKEAARKRELLAAEEQLKQKPSASSRMPSGQTASMQSSSQRRVMGPRSGAGAVSGTSQRQPAATGASSRPIIQNNRRTASRSGTQASGLNREEQKSSAMRASAGGMRSGVGAMRAGAGASASASAMSGARNTQAQSLQQKPIKPSSKPTGSSAVGHKPIGIPQDQPKMTQEELDLQMIQQLMEEDESRMLAEQMQAEMYQGGGSSARGMPGGAASLTGGPQSQSIGADGNAYDEMGNLVRAAQPQVFDQLIGGSENAHMEDLDEISDMRHRARGQRPQRNQPRPEEDNAWSQAPAEDEPSYNAMDLRATTRQDELERAIQASMEQSQSQASSQHDEDAQLARILEMSKNQR